MSVEDYFNNNSLFKYFSQHATYTMYTEYPNRWVVAVAPTIFAKRCDSNMYFPYWYNSKPVILRPWHKI